MFCLELPGLPRLGIAAYWSPHRPISEEMLVRAQRNVPKADFKQLDLLGDWGGLETQHFGAIVSAYVFHEFSLATKLELLTRLAGLLRPGGSRRHRRHLFCHD